ncbi:MAG: acylneuraminate cytidylyltransferase family protein [Gammaproteobacteria bacterium]
MTTYTAIIPARSGSKRLPNKNVKILGGKPLVAWTLQACAEASSVDEVIFSTDSLEYWEIAQQHVKSDKMRLDFRAPDEAGDNVKIFDYLKGKRSKIFGEREGAFILALPTVPFRRAEHVEEAIALFESSGKAVFSATNYGFPISFAFRMPSQDAWEAVFPESPMLTGNTRSQNQQEAYHPNGAIYVRSIADLADPNLQTLYTNALPYLMSRTDSIDIDSEVDFKMAAALL